MSTRPRRYTTCARGISEGCPSTGRTSAFAMVVRWVERGHFIHAPEVPKNRREPSSRKVGNHASPIRWGFISGPESIPESIHSSIPGSIHSSIHRSIHAHSSRLSIVGGGESRHLSRRQYLRSRERGVSRMSCLTTLAPQKLPGLTVKRTRPGLCRPRPFGGNQGDTTVVTIQDTYHSAQCSQFR